MQPGSPAKRLRPFSPALTANAPGNSARRSSSHQPFSSAPAASVGALADQTFFFGTPANPLGAAAPAVIEVSLCIRWIVACVEIEHVSPPGARWWRAYGGKVR